jgi:hypothetical protein
MRQFRSSGSVEGVMGNHDSYSDCDPERRHNDRSNALGRSSRTIAILHRRSADSTLSFLGET